MKMFIEEENQIKEGERKKEKKMKISESRTLFLFEKKNRKLLKTKIAKNDPAKTKERDEDGSKKGLFEEEKYII